MNTHDTSGQATRGGTRVHDVVETVKSAGVVYDE
jgi:hypothetical protein